MVRSMLNIFKRKDKWVFESMQTCKNKYLNVVKDITYKIKVHK